MKPTRPLHYDDPNVFGGLNLCSVRGTWSATHNVRKVTCHRCRKRLSYWVRKRLRATGHTRTFSR